MIQNVLGQKSYRVLLLFLSLVLAFVTPVFVQFLIMVIMIGMD